MRFSLSREALLKPLQQVIGVVERRQTLPVLSHLLLEVRDATVAFTGTDLEVELVARARLDEGTEAVDGVCTLPARKCYEIVRALPDGCRVLVQSSGEKVTLSAGRSRYALAALPAQDFPMVEALGAVERVVLAESVLKDLIERTAFAMAQQDIRYYLNGLLFDLRSDRLLCVATDGHRLALCEAPLSGESATRRQLILPRKGVLELQRLLESGDRQLELELARNHLRVHREDVRFTSKLIDGRFPDYDAVIPIGADKIVEVDREALRSALQRAAILCNEKFRGVKLEASPGQLRIIAHNPEQEEAQEDLEAHTGIEPLAIGFNVGYLLDALSVLKSETVVLHLRDGHSSAMLREKGKDHSRHVVMPLRL